MRDFAAPNDAAIKMKVGQPCAEKSADFRLKGSLMQPVFLSGNLLGLRKLTEIVSTKS